MNFKNISLILAATACFAVQSQAQYDDIYFDGVEKEKVQATTTYNSNASGYDDEVVESERVGNTDTRSNRYRDDYKAGRNYDPYDYEYASRVRRFHNSAPGFSYYSNYYVDQYYYNPNFGGNSIYVVSGPSYWNYRYSNSWRRNYCYNNWSPYGFNRFNDPYTAGYYAGAYNSGFNNGYYGNNGYFNNGYNNYNGFNNGYYNSATPSAATFANNSPRYSSAVRSSTNGGRSTSSLHSSATPYGRQAYTSNSSNSSTGDRRANAYQNTGARNNNTTTNPSSNNSSSNGYRGRSNSSTNGYNSGNTNSSTNNAYNRGRSNTTTTSPSYNSSGSTRNNSSSYGGRSNSSSSNSSSTRSSSSSSSSKSSSSGSSRSSGGSSRSSGGRR